MREVEDMARGLESLCCDAQPRSVTADKGARGARRSQGGRSLKADLIHPLQIHSVLLQLSSWCKSKYIQ